MRVIRLLNRLKSVPPSLITLKRLSSTQGIQGQPYFYAGYTTNHTPHRNGESVYVNSRNAIDVKYEFLGNRESMHALAELPYSNTELQTQYRLWPTGPRHCTALPKHLTTLVK